MGTARPLSPAARRRLHTGSTVWGALLSGLWLAVTGGLALDDSLAAARTAQGWLWAVLLPGLVLLVNGRHGARAARRYHVRDSALADALTVALDALCRTDPFGAYRTDPSMPEVRDARLVELDRHLDRQTVGATAGRTGHLTTRDRLMGDALCALVEAAGPAGPRDTFRVVSVSTPAAAGWVHAVVLDAAGRFEGPLSHAGATLVGWSGTLVRTFVPPDISYAADRLRAQAARPVEWRDPLTVRGPAVGRDALLAAQLQVGVQPPLLLFPVQLPVLLGRAVAAAAHEVDAGASGRSGTALLRRTGPR